MIGDWSLGQAAWPPGSETTPVSTNVQVVAMWLPSNVVPGAQVVTASVVPSL